MLVAPRDPYFEAVRAGGVSVVPAGLKTILHFESVYNFTVGELDAVERAAAAAERAGATAADTFRRCCRCG